MLLAAAAWLVAATCILVSARWLARMLRLAASAEELLAALRAIDSGGARARDNDLVQAELGEAIEAPSKAHRIAVLNERLADISRDLQVGSAIPRAATRIALFSGAACAVIELSRTLPEASVASIALAFFAGMTGSLITAQLARLGAGAAGRTRQAWKEVIRRVEKAARSAKPAVGGAGAGTVAPAFEPTERGKP